MATRPRVPIMGMDGLARCRVVWLNDDEPRQLGEIIGELPRVLFTSGWGVPLFNRFRDEVHVAGGKVIAMSDNNFRLSVRELVKAMRFNLLIRSRYEGYFVAGRSCADLLRFYGVSASKIRMGMYSADEELFSSADGDVVGRPQKIIFVGQLCDRKNPLRMCEAFRQARGYEKGWRLELYGCGPLKDRIPQGKGVSVHDFLQPEQLAAKYREARIFCLPSLEEHWGLVVHEAALSGCFLLLSDGIGARADFLGMRNGQTFNPYDVGSIRNAFCRAMALTDEELCAAQKESRIKASTVSKERFVLSVLEFCA